MEKEGRERSGQRAGKGGALASNTSAPSSPTFLSLALFESAFTTEGMRLSSARQLLDAIRYHKYIYFGVFLHML